MLIKCFPILQVKWQGTVSWMPRLMQKGAYEAVVSNTLKQERGQFFTPRNIARLMVEMMDPGEEHYVLDPACGGGFLVMVLDHVRKKTAREYSNQVLCAELAELII